MSTKTTLTIRPTAADRYEDYSERIATDIQRLIDSIRFEAPEDCTLDDVGRIGTLAYALRAIADQASRLPSK